MDPRFPAPVGRVSGVRFYATLVSMLSLAVAAAPPDVPATLPATEPTTTSVVVTPTTVQVVIENAEPTTEAVVEAARKGNVYLQAATVLGGKGVRETVAATRWWQWLMALAVILLGLAVGHTITRIFRWWATRTSAGRHTLRKTVIQSFAGPLGLFVAVLGLGVAIFAVIKPPLSVVATLLPVFQLLHIYVVGWLLFNLVDVITILTSHLTRSRQGNLSVTLVPMIRRTLRVILLVVLGLFAANNVFNWQIGALLAGLGIAGLAVSLAAQDMIRNLFGSVMIFADQPFSIGDRVKIVDQEGVVEDIGFRSSRLRTAEGSVVTIPNGNIAAVAVVNHSKRRIATRTFDLTLAADTSRETIEPALEAIRTALAKAATDDADDGGGIVESPLVTLEDLGALRVRISYNIKKADERGVRLAAQRVNLLLMHCLQDLGISYR